jgi:hypothetical protein
MGYCGKIFRRKLFAHTVNTVNLVESSDISTFARFRAEEAAEKLHDCHPEGRVCPRDLLFS